MILICSSCSTVSKSTLLGVGTGITVGTANGLIVNKSKSSQVVLTSALFMGVIGGLIGYFGHNELENRDAETRKETLFNLEKYGVSGFSYPVKPLQKESKNE